MGEIIYKKQFHRETIDEIEAAVRDSKEDLGDDSEQAITFDEIMKKIYSDVTYLVLPEREKKSKPSSKLP